MFQLMEGKSTIKYLFQANSQEGQMTINQFLGTFEVIYSEQGSNRRIQEEEAYRSFVRYAREVYGKFYINE